MGEYQFGVTGQDRKNLVAAISEFLNIPSKYLGAPGFKYQVGDYIIDRHGTVIGKYDEGLFVQLVERGFVSLVGTSDEEDVPEAKATEETAEAETIDKLCIEVPLDGFTPENIENLCKMVLAKESLIKKALGAESLPVKVLSDRIAFSWFNAAENGNVGAYAQFIHALCETAKEKKRVTSKPQEEYENEKFTMRVWLIGLGLIEKKYTLIRKLMGANLGGNSAFRYGKPERVPVTAAPVPQPPMRVAVYWGKAGMNSQAELQADAELIHAVNELYEEKCRA